MGRAVSSDVESDRPLARAGEPAFSFDLVLTREPGGRRLDGTRIAGALARLGVPAHAFVCGGNRFAGAVADLLVDAGIPAAHIRTERFGGSVRGARREGFSPSRCSAKRTFRLTGRPCRGFCPGQTSPPRRWTTR